MHYIFFKHGYGSEVHNLTSKNHDAFLAMLRKNGWYYLKVPENVKSVSEFYKAFRRYLRYDKPDYRPLHLRIPKYAIDIDFTDKVHSI